MPSYSYIAKNLKGESRTGVLEAENEHELAKALREEGYILVSAMLERKKSKKFIFSFSIFSGISLVEKIMFTKNLRVMIGAGLSLPRALDVLARQVKSNKFKEVIINIKKRITKGESFSESLRKHPNVFNELFINMVKVGEEAGTLEEILGVLTNQMEKNHELKSKLKGAMIYPAVVLSAMVGIGILMMIIVVPKLSDVYADLHIDLPITTKLILVSGNFMGKFWYLVIGTIFGFLFLIKVFLKTKTGKVARDTLFLKAPILSPIIKETNSAQTVRTLSSLIKAGVPIVRALEITARTLGNVYYQEALSKTAGEVKKGNKLAETLGRYKKIYPDLVVQMLKVGEETGETATILEKLADFYEEEVSNTTENLSSIIEPILMLVIGGAVGFFAISIIQPIYGMMEGL